MEMDIDDDDWFFWNIESDVVIENESDDGVYYLEPYNFVSYALDEECSLFKNLIDSRKSMYHDPLIDKNSWNCLKKYTSQLEDFLNKI